MQLLDTGGHAVLPHRGSHCIIMVGNGHQSGHENLPDALGSMQVHRIPIVDDQAKLVGIVTRTDIFTALEGTV